jgi:hypothetical protein
MSHEWVYELEEQISIEANVLSTRNIQRIGQSTSKQFGISKRNPQSMPKPQIERNALEWNGK